MPLLQSQKNALLHAIRGYEIDPLSFTLSETTSGETYIFYDPTEYHFEIKDSGNDNPEHAFIVGFTPGESTYSESKSYLSWYGTHNAFQSWLGYLKREIAQPDLWGALAQSQLPNTLTDDNSPFSEPERQVVRERLGQIRDYAYRVLPELTEQPELGQRLEARLDYLAESSERMGRKDWYNIFIGTIVSYIFTNTMDSNAARDFLEFAWQAIIHQMLPSLPY